MVLDLFAVGGRVDGERLQVRIGGHALSVAIVEDAVAIARLGPLKRRLRRLRERLEEVPAKGEDSVDSSGNEDLRGKLAQYGTAAREVYVTSPLMS